MAEVENIDVLPLLRLALELQERGLSVDAVGRGSDYWDSPEVENLQRLLILRGCDPAEYGFTPESFADGKFGESTLNACRAVGLVVEGPPESISTDVLFEFVQENIVISEQRDEALYSALAAFPRDAQGNIDLTQQSGEPLLDYATRVRALQSALGVNDDGSWGPTSSRALEITLYGESRPGNVQTLSPQDFIQNPQMLSYGVELFPRLQEVVAPAPPAEPVVLTRSMLQARENYQDALLGPSNSLRSDNVLVWTNEDTEGRTFNEVELQQLERYGYDRAELERMDMADLAIFVRENNVTRPVMDVNRIGANGPFSNLLQDWGNAAETMEAFDTFHGNYMQEHFYQLFTSGSPYPIRLDGQVPSFAEGLEEANYITLDNYAQELHPVAEQSMRAAWTRMVSEVQESLVVTGYLQERSGIPNVPDLEYGVWDARSATAMREWREANGYPRGRGDEITSEMFTLIAEPTMGYTEDLYERIAMQRSRAESVIRSFEHSLSSAGYDFTFPPLDELLELSPEEFNARYGTVEALVGDTELAFSGLRGLIARDASAALQRQLNLVSRDIGAVRLWEHRLEQNLGDVGNQIDPALRQPLDELGMMALNRSLNMMIDAGYGPFAEGGFERITGNGSAQQSGGITPEARTAIRALQEHWDLPITGEPRVRTMDRIAPVSEALLVDNMRNQDLAVGIRSSHEGQFELAIGQEIWSQLLGVRYVGDHGVTLEQDAMQRNSNITEVGIISGFRTGAKQLLDMPTSRSVRRELYGANSAAFRVYDRFTAEQRRLRREEGLSPQEARVRAAVTVGEDPRLVQWLETRSGTHGYNGAVDINGYGRWGGIRLPMEVRSRLGFTNGYLSGDGELDEHSHGLGMHMETNIAANTIEEALSYMIAEDFQNGRITFEEFVQLFPDPERAENAFLTASRRVLGNVEFPPSLEAEALDNVYGMRPDAAIIRDVLRSNLDFQYAFVAEQGGAATYMQGEGDEAVRVYALDVSRLADGLEERGLNIRGYVTSETYESLIPDVALPAVQEYRRADAVEEQGFDLDGVGDHSFVYEDVDGYHNSPLPDPTQGNTAGGPVTPISLHRTS